MAFSLTSEQQAAVDNRGGGLLVSAAAGSGKTRVLVERLLARVEGEGLDIDRFLVITYTKAAAAELRGRIVEELSARLAERPTDAHLRRQATLVYKAQISTVHAFCAQLLRECGHLLELDPDFRLCDEGEAGILMLRALNDVLDRRYEDIAEGSDFARLVDTMSAGRDDSRLMQIVLDIRGRVQAHPNPAAWLDGQERAFALEGVDDPGETPWGRMLLDDAGRQGAYWRDKIAQALELCPCDANLDANYAPSLSATLAALDAFVEGTRRGWDAARAALPIPFPTAGRKKMVDCPDAAEQVKAIRSTCKKRMEKLGEWFEDCGADLLEDLRAVHPAVRGLFALVKDFEGAYAAEKARRGMVDFADLEHMAVRLLVGEDGAPTELARQWSARYDEIMVDEYQDTALSPTTPRRRRGRSGGSSCHGTSAPGRRCWRGPTLCSATSCPPTSARWTTPPTRPSIPVRPSRPTAATPWSWTRWTPPPRGRRRRPPGISSRPALRPSASGSWWTGASPSPTARAASGPSARQTS